MKKIKISVFALAATVLGIGAASAMRPTATVRYVKNSAGTGYQRISEADYANPLIGSCATQVNTYCSFTGSDTQLTQTTYTNAQLSTLVSQSKAHPVTAAQNKIWQFAN